MPYAHRYTNSLGEVGALETLRRFAPGGAVEVLFKGAVSAVTQDANKFIEMLVDAKMKRFAGTRTPIVFLQNVVTDPLLGLKPYPLFSAFARYFRERYGPEAGFITMNLPMLVDAFEQAGVENPIACANNNKIGFRMCGKIDAYWEVLRSGRCRTVAISVLASGAIPAREAIEWVCRFEGLDAIVFGGSSSESILQTKHLIDEAWGLKVAPRVTHPAASSPS
jgi:hypothetical protein